MAGVKFPSSFDVTGRFPLDAKYWVDSITNLSDGEIYVGLHRWTLDTGKEYVYQKNNTWKEAAGGEKGNSATITIGNVVKGDTAKVVNVGTSTDAILNITLPKGDAGNTPIIDIGTVSKSSTPNVTNVGTTDRAILNFALPSGENGLNGLDGKSVFIAYADSITGLNPSYSFTNKKFISFVTAYQQPLLTAFTTWSQLEAKDGVKGTSLFIAYSAFSNGQNASYTLNTTHKYISIISALALPLLSEFTTWVLFKGADGGAAGLSAYESWLRLGNTGTEAQFIDSLSGNNGLSAYQIWLNEGNFGTEQDFINSLSAKALSANIKSIQVVAGSDGPQLLNIPADATDIVSITIKEPSTYTRITTSYTYTAGVVSLLTQANIKVGDVLECKYVVYTGLSVGNIPIPNAVQIELTPVINY